MIENINLENFKSHRSTQLNLDDSRLHAIVGQNSAGKTLVLEALHYINRLSCQDFKSIFQHERFPQFLTTVGQCQMSVTVCGFWGYRRREQWKASYRWEQENSEWMPTASFTADREDSVRGWRESLSNAPSPIPQALKYAVYLKLVASNLNQATYSDEVTPRVEYDGSGLAPTLDFIRNETPEKFKELQQILQKVVPGVRGVGIKRAKVKINRQRSIEVNGQFIPYEEHQDVTGQEVIFDMNTGTKIPAHAISEGTILALGLLTVLMHPNQPNLVLLDDIEQGLHPKAQRELMDVIKEILTLNKNLQIIFSTHSPYIVDELKPSQVHVLYNPDEGFTISKRLDEHPDIEWAKQALTTGEFWDAEGEEWVVGSENS